MRRSNQGRNRQNSGSKDNFRSKRKPSGSDDRRAGRSGSPDKPRRSFSKPGEESRPDRKKQYSRGDNKPAYKKSSAGRDDRPRRNFSDDERSAGGKEYGRGPKSDFKREGNPDRSRRNYPGRTDDKRPGERGGYVRGEKPAFRGGERNSETERPRTSSSKGDQRRSPRDDFRSEERPGYRSNDRNREDKRRRTSPGDDTRQRRYDNSSDTPAYRKSERREERPRRSSSSGEERKTRFTDNRTERPAYRKDERSRDDVRPRRSSSGDEYKGTRERSGRRETGDSNENKGGKFSRPYDKKKSDQPWNRKEKHEFYGDRLKSKKASSSGDEDGVRLNKYIANAGICSRREADELIAAGVVSVNGEIVTAMGYKVQPGDIVRYNNETLKTERVVYVLLNKPKDFISTTDDPENRKTVMSLVEKACRERIYPVGRLDRNTTGVLLFTNDGDLAKKLTHPSFEVHKVYQVELDRALKGADLEKIREGVSLEDGIIKADEIVYTTADKNVVGIELHSGKNRIVRRIFEHLGYEVKKLDRVVFAGLTKKDLPRGRWRFLTDMEIASLKMLTGKKAISHIQ